MIKFPNTFPAKGEIYYIQSDPNHPSVGNEIWSNRPGIVVSNDTSNKTSGFVEVVYLSTSKKKKPSPTHIPVISGNKEAFALCEQVHTVDNSRLSTFMNKITDEELEDVESAILFGLGINHGPSANGIFKKWESYIKEQNLADYESDVVSGNDENVEYLKSELTKYKELCNTLQTRLDSIKSLIS